MDLVQLYIPILENLSEAVHISDLMGRVIYLNPACQKMTGCSLEEAKGRRLEEVFQGPNAGVETRHPCRFDMPAAPITWRRGTKAYRTTIAPIPGPEGQIEYMMGSTTELDAELEGLDPSILDDEPSGMLDQILSASPDLIAIFDRDLRFVYVNRSLSRVLDVERETIIGKGLEEVLPSSDVVPEMEDQIEAVIQSGKGCDGMFSYALPRGARTFEYILSPVRDARSEVLSVMATLRDVTERNRGEDALLLDEARLEALLRLNQMTGSDLEEIIAFALRAAVKLTNSKFGYIASIGPDGATLHMHSWHFEGTHQSLLDQDVEIPLTEAGIWGEVLLQRRPVVENVVQDLSLAASPVLQDAALNRLMSIPIFDGERIAALAGVADKVEPYDDTDLRQLTLMMDGMWRLVQRKRLEDSIRQARDLLEARVKERTLELDRVNKDLRKEIVGHTNTEIALQKELSRRRELEEIINRGPIVVFLRRAEDGWPVELVSESIDQFGYRPGDFHDGLTFSSIIHPLDRERVERVVVARSLPGIDEFTQIYRILTKLGEPRWVEDRSLVRRDDEGRITHYQGIIYDITERREAEEELCSARQRLEYIIDFLPDATFAIDKDKRVIAWNRAMEEMTGASKEEMIGKADYAYAIPFYGKPRPMLIDFVGMGESEDISITMERYLYRKVERKGDTLFALVFVPAFNQGRGSHLWAKASLHMDDEGNVLGSIESMRDITDSVTAENQLLKRDALLTGVAVAANALLTIPEFESAVNQSLEMLGLAADAEKAYVFENQEDPVTGELFAERRFMWSRDGSGHEDTLSVLSLDGSFARWRSLLERGVVVKGLARDFPYDEQEVLNKEGILSILAVPIVIEGRFWGFVGFFEGRLEREWDMGEVSILWVSAGSLGSAIMNKRSDESLRNSEERFRAIFETAQDCIFIKDRFLRYVQVNPAVSRLFGIPMDEMVGMVDSDLFGSDAARYLSKLDARVLEGEIVDEEHTKPVKGFLTTFHVVKVPIRDNSGTITGLCGFARDITERKRMEVALKESERRLADIIEFLPDPTLVIDREGKVIAWNRAIVAMTGIRAEDMLGKGNYEYAIPFYGKRRPIIIDLVLNPDHDIEAGYGNIERRNETLVGEAYMPNLKGGELYLVGSATALYDSNGNIFGAIESIRDITERKRAEEQIQFQASLLDQVRNAVVATDLDGGIIYWNRFAEVLSGWSAEEALSRNIMGTIVPEDRADMVGVVMAEIQKNGYSERELNVRRKDGSVFLAHHIFSMIRDMHGRNIGILGVIVDITERKQVEREIVSAKEAALAATRAKSEFLANMSHEIRTPMNAVIGMTGLLLDSPLNLEQEECVEIIRGSGDALLGIINDILDFSKIDEDLLEIESQPFDLMEAIKASLDLVAKTAEEKGLELGYRMEESAPSVILGDVTRFRQVLVNLLSNAVKFTEKGHVSVRVSSKVEEGDLHRILVSVEDTGIGIPPDRQSRLFQSFSQVDSTTTRKYGGTGLGLAISKRLVEMMGGRIWMESTPGKGSTFNFSIRARAILQASTSHEAIQGPSPRIKLDDKVARRHPLRILLAEDNVINQKVALKMLARMGYRADVAASGIEVLQALDRQRYDLILMDVQMPEMDGLETTERILSRWPKEERPQIIAMTAHALAADKERCLQSGMDDYVSKPVELQDLRSALERAAQRRASRPQTPALDQRILGGLRELQEEGESDIVCELGELFMSNAPGRLELMCSALHIGDATALFRAAHDMKSSSANIGALRLSEICRQVEMMGRSGDLDGADERLILIDMEIARVRSALLEEASCHPQDEPASTK